MFKKSIDSKSTYFKEGIKIKDLTESIFNIPGRHMELLNSYYRVSKELIMRPDKISSALYGSDEYAEIVIKHSGIDNPFAIDEGDLLSAPTLNSVYHNVKSISQFTNNDTYINDAAKDATSTYDFVKKYHKYIDKSKLPETTSQTQDNSIFSVEQSANLSRNNMLNSLYGSSNNGNDNTSSSSSNSSNVPVEANIANKGRSGITVANGRIYFGDNVSASTANLANISSDNNANTDLVDCAKNGVTLGQFLHAVIKNNVDKQ